MDLTPEQIAQLQSLGITIPLSTDVNKSNKIKIDQNITPSSEQIQHQTISSNQDKRVLIRPKSPVVPILSISGITLLSFGGILLFKSQETASVTPSSPTPIDSTQPAEQPTQVPKSIQHYLLTSQQYFTSALQAQQNTSASPNSSGEDNSNTMISFLNQSITAATEAIKEFPNDYRGWEQRGRIYQSLSGSQPQMLTMAINDFKQATQLNPSSIDTAHTLASLYAQVGDTNNTLSELSRIVTIEPTKAQNFYDLARLQQQTGNLSQALNTYNHLLTLLTDQNQKQQIEIEKQSLEKLVAQSPVSNTTLPSPSISPDSLPSSSFEGNLIQASTESELIIAAPQTTEKIEVSNLTSSNSLSGTATLPANTTQLSLTNSNLTSTSQVYLTIIKGGKNLSLQTISRSGNTFVVGLDSPASEDIEFKWWIVNQ